MANRRDYNRWVARESMEDYALRFTPRAITKHLEHVLHKLGVEARTAAAGMAMQRVRNLAAEPFLIRIVCKDS